MPVARKGTFGRYLGSIAAHAAAREEKLAGSFKPGTHDGGFYDIEIFNCASASNCPGRTIEFDFADYGLSAVTEQDVRDGSPVEGHCPDRRSEIACAICEDGYYGSTGECQECSGSASGVNAMICIVFPFIMLALYRATASGNTQRVQSAFILVSTCGMAAFFMQTIAVLDTFDFTWPPELSWLFDISRILMFDLGALSLSCMHGNSFAAKYWATIIIPLFVVGMTGIAFIISRLLPLGADSDWKMLPNQTFSMIGMFMSALYVTLVKVVLTYFECPGNPAGPATLAKYKDIICQSDDHTAGFAPMIIGLLLYVVGFYGIFCYAAYSAPVKWTDIGFRERWKFMLTRWRPDTYYWGTMVMTRNLLVAFGGVVSSEPRVQLCYVIAVVMVVFSATAVWQPWRAPTLNHYDVVSCILLCCIGVVGLIFVSVEEEISLATRLGAMTIVSRKDSMRDAFATSLTVLVAAFVALFMLLMCWCCAAFVPSQHAKSVDAHLRECAAVNTQLLAAVKHANFEENAKRLIDESTAYDRAGLQNFISKLDVDPTSISSGTTDTISIKRLAPEPAVVSA